MATNLQRIMRRTCAASVEEACRGAGSGSTVVMVLLLLLLLILDRLFRPRVPVVHGVQPSVPLLQLHPVPNPLASRCPSAFGTSGMPPCTSSSDDLRMQSRTACSTMPTRRSSAVRCGSHSTGAIGSTAIDSRIASDSDRGPLWKRSSVSSVDARIRQHCSTGARMDSSSWNGLPNPRP
uniref:Uncharacterized protein n=1 Tax=Anopheles melas TaxID=34690 RepID=A0A182TNQ8_9DIPT